jgi:Glycosyltransferase 61
MQQLYRCWSWWIANPQKQPILLFKHHPRTRKSPFLNGFLKTLENTIGLKILLNHTGPVVRSKDTGKWEKDINITDFAMLDPEQKLRKVFMSYIPAVIDPPCQAFDDKRRFPRISIVNRRLKSGRHLRNAKELAASIEATYPDQSVAIVYFEEMSFLDQIEILMKSDIVISPHGAQLVGLPFMPPCSSVLEFFPRNYLVADYFGSLAAAAGIDHSFFYLGNNKIPKIQQYHYMVDATYRNNTQCPQMDKVMAAVTNLISNWNSCCSTISLNVENKARIGAAAVSKPPNPKQWSGNEPVDTESASVFIEKPRTLEANGTMTIDIVSAGSIQRKDLLRTQARTFGTHPLVRDFYGVTEHEDSDALCSTSLTETQRQRVLQLCWNGTGQSRASRLFRTDLFAPSSNATGWLCAQKRPIDGLHLAFEKYKAHPLSIPDYLMVIDDDTYLNIDALAATFQKYYPPSENRVVAGCTYMRPRRLKFIFPIGGVGSMFTRAAIQKLLQPLHCQARNSPAEDPFEQWACWRLESNALGEQRFFTDGMSVGDLMYAYTAQQPYTEVEQWDTGGYCFHSDHTLAYFLNYYFIAVPDAAFLTTPQPTDAFRRTYGYQVLAESREVPHRGRGGECDNLRDQCTVDSRICHYVTAQQMETIFQSQQKARDMV